MENNQTPLRTGSKNSNFNDEFADTKVQMDTKMSESDKKLLVFNEFKETTKNKAKNNEDKARDTMLNMWNSSEQTLNNVLLSIGIFPNRNGFDYIKKAVLTVVFKSKACAYKLYEIISKETNTSPASIERAIRHSVNQAYNSGKLKRINSLFSVNIVDNYHLTNTEIIALLAQYVAEKKPWLE